MSKSGRKKVGILCENILQADLKTFLAGGGERYILDFIDLLQKNNYDVEIYQFSCEKKIIQFKGLTINGIGNITSNNYMQCLMNGSQYFADMTKDCDGLFFLSMNLCQGFSKLPSITVSHGLWWDGYENNPSHGINMMDYMKVWIKNSTECISVDTNSIHALQVYAPKVAHRMTFIPNYVDLSIFKADEKDDSGVLNVIFPRRIDQARGYIEMVEAIKVLNIKYPNTFKFLLCGRGQPDEEQNLIGMISGMDNVDWTSYDTESMPEAYKGMNISCVPTVRAEGTSLAAIESLATGAVPIVTTVGGLTDIVFNNVNGLMIKPKDSKALARALEYLHLNRNKLQEMREIGLKIINGFSKERWNNEILEVVKRVYN